MSILDEIYEPTADDLRAIEMDEILTDLHNDDLYNYDFDEEDYLNPVIASPYDDEYPYEEDDDW